MADPDVSVIIPLYRSGRTLPGCLRALASQTCTDFEIVLVDSSPDASAGHLATELLPRARYVHVSRRLNSQSARNRGAELARGHILVFTDPDIYPPPDWLRQMLEAHRRLGAVILGPIACHGRRWIDWGAHLCKFSICLPGGCERKLELGWSGNFLVRRDRFQAVGGWAADWVQGDSVSSNRLLRLGEALWLVPRALVYHDHANVRLSEMLAERYQRGREFGGLEKSGLLSRESGPHPPRPRHALPWMALRYAAGLLRVAGRALRAGYGLQLVWALPLVVLGVGAWYTGIAVAYRDGERGRTAVEP
jgi:glycosyltransferase involved in cell wall biosynthesis